MVLNTQNPGALIPVMSEVFCAGIIVGGLVGANVGFDVTIAVEKITGIVFFVGSSEVFCVGIIVGGLVGTNVGFDVTIAVEKITGFVIVGGNVGFLVVVSTGAIVFFLVGSCITVGLNDGCLIGLGVIFCLDIIASTGLERVSPIVGGLVRTVIDFGLTEGELVGLFVGLLVTGRRMAGVGAGVDFSNTLHIPSIELKIPLQFPSLTKLSSPSW
mmetsp:Transcript_30795/g.34949  ORF Transcript_30795/g.34949 Transcript_30795/m.34949 type:complete len:214 (-) Transcript_30795:310-951(-)